MKVRLKLVTHFPVHSEVSQVFWKTLARLRDAQACLSLCWSPVKFFIQDSVQIKIQEINVFCQFTGLTRA